MTARAMVDTLGAFQYIWDAWNESDAEIKAKPLEHFEVAVRQQFIEMREHLAEGRRANAANEAMDIASIALNLLRNLGYQPDEVVELAKSRANRMSGETPAILAKYQRLYDV